LPPSLRRPNRSPTPTGRSTAVRIRRRTVASLQRSRRPTSSTDTVPADGTLPSGNRGLSSSPPGAIPAITLSASSGIGTRLAGSSSTAARSAPRAPRVLRMPIVPSSGRFPDPQAVGVIATALSGTTPPDQRDPIVLGAPACRSGPHLLDGARMTSRRAGPAVTAFVLASGCDPVINVYGSFFPAWALCLLVGGGGAGALRVVFA